MALLLRRLGSRRLLSRGSITSLSEMFRSRGGGLVHDAMFSH